MWFQIVSPIHLLLVLSVTLAKQDCICWSNYLTTDRCGKYRSHILMWFHIFTLNLIGSSKTGLKLQCYVPLLRKKPHGTQYINYDNLSPCWFQYAWMVANLPWNVPETWKLMNTWSCHVLNQSSCLSRSVLSILTGRSSLSSISNWDPSHLILPDSF